MTQRVSNVFGVERRIRDYVNWIFDNPGTPWPGNQLLKHTFWLRSDCKVTVNLPCDFVGREAERLNDAIRTFPTM